MKKAFVLFAIVSLSTIGCKVKNNDIVDKVNLQNLTLPKELSPNPKNMTMVFNDDFNEKSLNETAWGRFDRSKTAPWSRYICDTIPELVEVSRGNLRLRAVWDKAKKHPWTGCVQTRFKKAIKYGRVDVKAKFSQMGNGGWPAIWMLSETPVYKGWPAGGEIDIMEQINTEHQIHQTFHQGDSTNMNIDVKHRKDYITKIDPNEYHIYSMVKLPKAIGLYVDYKLTAVHYPNIRQGVSKYWPFETDFYLILNYACSDMGQFERGFWSKRITENDLKKGLFPYEMSVDYVRFYEY